MIKSIIKRDGREVSFDIEKIANAIYQAAEAIGGKNYQTSMDLARKVIDYIEEQGIERPTVEQIQDAVEHTLIEEGHSRTAKEFILYRSQRTRVREMNTRLMRVYEDLTFKSAKDNDVNVRMRTLTVTLPWEPCLNMVRRVQSSSMTCLFWIHSILRLIEAVTSIFTI